MDKFDSSSGTCSMPSLFTILLKKLLKVTGNLLPGYTENESENVREFVLPLEFYVVTKIEASHRIHLNFLPVIESDVVTLISRFSHFISKTGGFG